MKVSYQWLKEWIDLSDNSESIAETLTLAGLEVDHVSSALPKLHGITIAEVLKVSPHPNADRLRLCELKIADEMIPIVCGAANVRPGIKVPLAMIGAVLPGNIKIKKSKIRGEVSCGMICSTSELGITESSTGIMVLPKDAPVGVDFYEYIQGDDTIIDIDITPNRGDCLSVKGIARELSAIKERPLKSDPIETINAELPCQISIHVKAPEACPVYAARVITGINNQKKTPLWMQERLRRSGLRSINPVVDVTNYVMLALGQPLHAFDQAKLTGDIHVRYAHPQEKICLLDEKEIYLDKETLVIADEKHAQAIAGVMGAKAPAVTADTQSIVLESAFFNPATIIETTQKYLLSSESAYRFERGVDPQGQGDALAYATALLLELAGGEATEIKKVVSNEYVPQRKPIHLRKKRIERLLGLVISNEDIETYLRLLGMEVTAKNDAAWQVKPPTYRFDMTIETDLIEEIVRLKGYGNLPDEALTADYAISETASLRPLLKKTKAFLKVKDYYESISYSFVDNKLQQTLFPEKPAILLSNPIAENMAAMRLSLWPGLLSAVKFNLNHQFSRIRLFEIGLCFEQDKDEIQQIKKIAGVLTGDAHADQWGSSKRKIDFYDMKGDVAALLHLHLLKNIRFIPTTTHAALHPGRGAIIEHNGQTIGIMGQLNPAIQAMFDINMPVYLFELQADNLTTTEQPCYVPPSKYPAVQRDIAIIVNKNILAADLQKTIYKNGSKLLKNVAIFDIYEGEGMKEGKKSVAFHLTFQSNSYTLTDQEADNLTQRIIRALEENHHSILRDK